MAAGSLKMWNADRGFGFIKDDSGGPDIFIAH
jgi:cold shock CspA family protein